MQSTGHTSTHELSFVPMQGSAMTYANPVSLFARCLVRALGPSVGCRWVQPAPATRPVRRSQHFREAGMRGYSPGVILLTGASGTVGGRLPPPLLESGQDVRALVRDPRGLGRHRVDVQIALGDLARLGDRHLQRQALRGVDTVIHLAAAIRDESHARVEELNGLATARLLRAAERAGVERFIFFSALGASESQRTRFFRAKALAEQAVAESPLATTIFAPSIVYDPQDRWVRLMKRLALLPVVPISGSGRSRYQPIWARDVARCVIAALERGASDARYELAGPETLTYNEIARAVARAAGGGRPPPPA